MKTVEEARECCCPLSFAYIEGERERVVGVCQTTGCMMWRWGEKIVSRERRFIHERDVYTEPEWDDEKDDFKIIPPRPENVPSWAFFGWDELDSCTFWEWEESEEEAAARRRGWCGLSGRPEKD